MDLTQEIDCFIENPFPVWESQLTKLLVQQEWESLKRFGIEDVQDYSSAKCYYRSSELPTNKKQAITGTGLKLPEPVYLEDPSDKSLEAFLQDHDLVTLNVIEAIELNADIKVGAALGALSIDNNILPCISALVKSIHVLKQENWDTDMSFSHPRISFSIFVSVCNNNSMLSRLRVAESILHEAMHLKLTLIEKQVSLIDTNSSSTFYSPWREEHRSLQGVLHGLFVFSAIKEFHSVLATTMLDKENIDYSKNRIDQITTEFSYLKNFYKQKGITSNGARLIKSLLPLN